MAVPKPGAFLQALRDSGLLEPAQIDELAAGSQSQAEDALPLAREILRRGWLTRYQVNQLAAGRGKDLTVGPYRILDRLGEGAMGQVFKAQHAVMNRTVALKVIRKEYLANSTAVARFYKEVQAAAQLVHPNIVHAYDAGQAGAVHYFAMEYIDGIDLARLVQQSGPLNVGLACEYVRQAALGLQHAHGRGMVHRDIKPHNLLLASADEKAASPVASVKILDMGLARLLGGEGKDHALTQTGTVVGTPDFIAPEQALSSKAADIRSDIYSLGCTLYYLLAGRAPHHGTSLTEVLLKHQLHEPAPIEEIRKDVPAGVRAVLKKMLAKQPDDRYQAPADVAGALAPFAKLDGSKPDLVLGKERRESGDLISESSLSAEWSGSKTTSQSKAGSQAGAGSRLQSRSGSRTEVLPKSQRPAGLSLALRRLRKKKPKLFYGMAAGFLLLLLAVFLTPVVLALRPKGDKEAADASKLPSQASVNQDTGKPASQPGPDGRAQGQAVEIPPLALEHLKQLYVAGRAPVPGQALPGETDKDIIRRYRGGHTSGIWKLAISADGKRALTAGGDKKLVLWDLGTGERLKKSDLKKGVSQIALLPDGMRALILEDQGPLLLWDLDSDRLLAQFCEAPRSRLTSFALSADGNRLLGARHLGWCLLDIPTREEIKSVEFDSFRWLQRIAWSRDERFAYSALEVIRIWDVQKTKELKEFDGHAGGTGALALSANGTQLLSVGFKDKTARLWDLKTGKEIRSIPIDSEFIDSAVIAPDGRRAIVYSQFLACLWVLDLEVGRVTHTLGGRKGPEPAVDGVVLTPDGQALLLANREGLTLRRWPDVNPLPAPASNRGEGLALLPVEVPANPPNGPSAGEIRSFWGGEGPINSMNLSQDGRKLLTFTNKGRYRLYDVESGKLIRSYAINASRLIQSPDGRSLVGGSGTGDILEWDLETGQQKRVIQSGRGAMYLAFSKDGTRMISGGRENQGGGAQPIFVWDAKTWAEISQIPAIKPSKWLSGLALSNDGKLALSTGEDGFARLWDVDTKKELRSYLVKKFGNQALFFSDDGHYAAYSGIDELRLIDLKNLTELSHFGGGTGSISQLCFLADGRMFLTSFGNGGYWLEIRAGGARRFIRHPCNVNTTVALPDGRHFLTGGHDGVVRVFDSNQ